MKAIPSSQTWRNACRCARLIFLALLAPAVQAQFLDDFERSDSADVGNGWVEKRPAAFALNAGSVEKSQVSSFYRDNVVFRPASENLLDVEVSAEFQLDLLPPRYPQIFARIQTDTALFNDVLDGYILYVANSASSAVLGRQTGNSFVSSLANISISPALNTTDTFRLRMRVTGTAPVSLTAWVERLDGADWTVIGQAAATDSAASRIDAAGSVGFGGSHWEDQYSYDNFARTNLGGAPADNPVPQVSSLNPNAAAAGGPDFTLTVNGDDFVSASVVRWNGSDRPTTFVSPTQLQATINSTDIAAEGTANVTVATPAPGGGTSAALTFTIDAAPVNNPVPLIAGIDPATATEGDPAFVLTVNGSDFVASSVVRWNNTDRQTTYVSANMLQANISAEDISTAGTADVSVLTPAPGGGQSASEAFVIEQAAPAPNPQPVLSGISPNNATEGDPAFTLTATGSDFVSTSVVRWNGADRATTFVSATELQAAIPSADIAAPGTADVTVATPGPGGGVSGAQTFTVLDAAVDPNPLPRLEGLWPVYAEAGSGPLSVALWGHNFLDSSVVTVNGQEPTTFFNARTELTIQLSESDLATAGFLDIVVVNPSPGGGSSSTLTFEVGPASGNPLAPELNGLAPESWIENGGSFQLNVSGRRFTTGSEILWNGTPLPTTFVSEQSLQAIVPAAEAAAEQIATVTVSTPAPGGGVSMPQNFFVIDPARGYFSDNFNRSDSPVIGNDWTEKSDAEFSIFNGEIMSTATREDYKNNIFYRPTAEDRRDLEVSVEFRRLRGPSNLPQLHARVQRDSIQNPQSIESYILFVVDNNQPPIEAAFAIQPPDEWAECFIATFPFPSELEFDEQYRLRFRLTGDLPVQMTGFVDHWNGQSWDVFASGSTTHDFNTPLDPDLFCHPGYMPPPITDGGSTGLAKYRPRTDAYDNFYWRDFVSDPGLNPVPSLGSIDPASASAGDPSLTMTVNGTGFVPGSVVRWNGADRQTTFVSSTELLAGITSQDLSQPTTADITVFNPGPGGGTSSPLQFVVQDNSPPDPDPDPDPPPGGFSDDFSRPDSADLGNGWVEKNPGAFALVNGGAAKLNVSQGYRDNLVFRPAQENSLDTETSIEFRINANSPGYPQIFARLQTDTALTPGSMNAYMLYVSNSNTSAVLGRQRGGNFVTALANIAIAPGLNTNDLFRLRMRVEGTTSVNVNGYIERWNGAGWEILGQGSAVDTSGVRISTAGSTGFSGYVEPSYVYDNFESRDLSQ